MKTIDHYSVPLFHWMQQIVVVAFQSPVHHCNESMDVMCITSIWNILQRHNSNQMVMAIITVAFISEISMMYLHQGVLI